MSDSHVLARLDELMRHLDRPAGKPLDCDPAYIGVVDGALCEHVIELSPKRWDRLGGATVSIFGDIVNHDQSTRGIILGISRLKKAGERRHRYETSTKIVGVVDGRLERKPFRYSAFWAGDTWLCSRDEQNPVAASLDEDAAAVAADHGALPEYAWRLQFRAAELTVPLMLPTDAEGARALLQDRAPSGRTRRAALLHWVEGHYRRKPTGDGLAWVKQHMRGKTSCDWHGWHVTMLPSMRDIETAGW